MTDPLGIETPSPMLSWVLYSDGENQIQTAFEILAASSCKLLGEGHADLWDSGVIESGSSIQVPYGGKILASGQECWWKVRIRDGEGCWSGWSSSGFFETCLDAATGWKARWIYSVETDVSEIPAPAPLFRYSFVLDRPVKKARAYVCGLGYSELRINGSKISDDLLSPPFTQYDKTVLYCTYDVTAALAKRENTVAVILGNGWYNCFTPEVWNYRQAPWRHHPKLLLQIQITFEDGTIQTIVSDCGWKVSDGPIVFDGLRNGEYYDARLEKAGWDKPGYDDSQWKNAKIAKSPGGTLRPAPLPPIRLAGTIKPVSLNEVKPGVWVYDLGQNISGWAQIRVFTQPGHEIIIKYAEKIHQDGSLDASNISRLITGGEFQTDKYVTKGGGPEVWEPRFTYHGFQYIEVTGYPGIPTLDSLCGRVVHTALESRGSFSCSNELLNSIQKCARWSTLTNYHDIPTDCPHREKNGWTGDASLSSEQVLLNFAPSAAYTKWLRDFMDVQRLNGQLPGIVPTGGWGFNWGSGPAWDSAMILIPWNMYVYDGNFAILAEMYSGMARYIDFMSSMANGFLVDFGLGDWCPPEGGPDGYKCPTAVTDTGYYYADVSIMAKVALLLGRQKDAARFLLLAANIRQAFRKKFISQDGTVMGNCQTSMACALYQGLVSDEEKPNVFKKLVEQVELKNRHIDCGILGAKYVMHTLTEYGRADLAYAIATQTDFPSWGNWIRQGATTLWETWNGDASRNHHMFSDISAWFYRGLAGLRPDPECPGFKHIIIRPAPVAGLEYSGASHESPYGHVSANWRVDGIRFVLEVSVPANCTATVTMPNFYCSGVTVSRASGECMKTYGTDTAEVELGSGKYTITGERQC